MKNYQSNLIGIDEVGRGPLAGPVVAAAFLPLTEYELPSGKNSLFRDSKKLTQKKREELYGQLTKDHLFGVGWVYPETIDKINIRNATFLAMQLALDDLEQKNHQLPADQQVNVNGLKALIDGRDQVELRLNQQIIEGEAIIKGDENKAEIAAASIIAKVSRDNYMFELHEKFPNYGFDSHKGYGVKKHLQNIETYGACPAHRLSFSPFTNSF